jgi:hypothetical protein
MSRSPHPARLAIAVSRALLIVIACSMSATAATDFTQTVTQLSASQVQVSFTPTTPATFVDLHYLPPPTPPIGQQNVRMTNNAGTWQFTIGGLTSGFVLEYWFTYEKNGPAFDTPHFTFTVGGGGPGTVATPTFSPGGGSFSSAQSVTITTATADRSASRRRRRSARSAC